MNAIRQASTRHRTAHACETVAKPSSRPRASAGEKTGADSCVVIAISPSSDRAGTIEKSMVRGKRRELSGQPASPAKYSVLKRKTGTPTLVVLQLGTGAIVARVVDVLVPVALDKPYSYRVPPELDLAPGDIVTVPLGARETLGAVWGEGSARPGLDNRLKNVADKLDVPPLAAELRRFVDWVAEYTVSPRGMVLRM